MKPIFYFVVSLFFFLIAHQQSLASQPMTMQKDELLRVVTDVNNAIKSGNFTLISRYMPERLYKEMARRLNTTQSALRENFLQQLKRQFEGLPSDSYRLDKENIEYLQTDNGTVYALIPTVLEMKDRIIQYKTLAIFDKTQWYLIYGGQKTLQNPVFLEIYPDFIKVHLPIETITKK
ncbi:hypothetical protein [Bartonella rattimassiliensis]|uniref:Uncharacterized protein n=1 Tax=Bartonella rattimassiliensis 15908 TaxID=1094556 RepID=J1JK29_9HYPH|nr:hypothetical protein [Bartonella rattimassiliensis]EJF85007.1 hypothetical protein MCY_01390 [Bartonella rattimassiliensis 15908]